MSKKQIVRKHDREIEQKARKAKRLARLSSSQVNDAARLAMTAKAAGAEVLNDPQYAADRQVLDLARRIIL
jgi:hypothetical protein